MTTTRTAREALAKAVRFWDRKLGKNEGARSVYLSLVLLETWNKNQNPELAAIAHEDQEWVGRTYGVEEDGFRFTK